MIDGVSSLPSELLATAHRFGDCNVGLSSVKQQTALRSDRMYTTNSRILILGQGKLL